MTLTRFSDVLHLNTSRVADPLAAGIECFVDLEHIEPENLHIRNWGLVSDGVTFTNSFKPGQVLFGKRRAYQRKVALADFGGVCSSDIYVFESKDPNVLLPELLPFICQSEGFYQHAIKTSAGSQLTVLGTLESLFSMSIPDVVLMAAGATISSLLAAIGMAGSGTIKVGKCLVNKLNEQRKVLTNDTYSYLYYAKQEGIISHP